MSTYFGFSDESGDYIKNITARQLKKHPFYIRSTLLINSSEWKKLNNQFKDLKKSFDIPANKEIKWSFLWILKMRRDNGNTISEREPYKFLEAYPIERLESFVESAIDLINTLDYKKIILTYTDNEEINNHEEKHILKFHIQEMIQRIEMELQNDYNNLGVVFIDPVNEVKNCYFRDIYNDFFLQGDFIEKYVHIKDSLNIEFSHHSVGIQLSDFIAGIFNGVLRSSSDEHFKFSQKLFYNYVLSNVRRYKGRIHGYGIREVPSNSGLREKLANKISKYENHDW